MLGIPLLEGCWAWISHGAVFRCQPRPEIGDRSHARRGTGALRPVFVYSGAYGFSHTDRRRLAFWRARVPVPRLTVLDEALGATRPPFYLASQLKNDRNGSRVSNQQTVLRRTKDRWPMPGRSRRFRRTLVSCDSCRVGSGALQHWIKWSDGRRAAQDDTDRVSGVNKKNWDSTDFGRELEVTCHNHLGQNKVNALVSEMAGKTTGQTNVRLEKSPNFWCVIGERRGRGAAASRGAAGHAERRPDGRVVARTRGSN